MQPLAIVARPAPPPRRRRILAIDDDDGLLDMLVLLLRQSHLDFRAVNGGQAGLDLAVSWKPDLILLDLAMPDIDGATFLASYRKVAATPAPIVLLTGATDVPARAAELGVATFITKPFDLGDLVEIVDTYAWGNERDIAWG
jgi:two-component system response regulator AdeR